MIQPWPLESSEQVLDCRIFKVRKDVVVNPRNGSTHEMYVLEQPNWVNVIPLTDAQEVILIEQWRHGTRSVQLETPGGVMDVNETPEQCARRELLEETGYEAGELLRLGSVHPNPAIQNNLQYYVLATRCRKVAGLKLDHAEDIAVRLVPLSEIPALIRGGKITHGIVIGGFYQLYLWQTRVP
ncbi:MAG: NUDIX hydrolase [Verrucomicrobiae bacterium]|nr:NUDIX hydrolase [Verrucomicrobiae bacterium]